MPTIDRYKNGAREAGTASYYARVSNNGEIDTWRFFADAEAELRETLGRAGGDGRQVERSWLHSLRKQGLRWPSKGEERREFEPPGEPLLGEDLPGSELPEWPGETPVLCVRENDCQICPRLPMLPAAWLESASGADRDALKLGGARLELGDASVPVTRLRYRPLELPLPEQLLQQSITPIMRGQCPISLDLTGHLRTNAGIGDGLAMFRPIKAGGTRLTE